ncbi:BlaI/MecI/CopY family transcriptional regulator [Paucibacter sp. APW11]|uniref:BlaI/MecI/CopY family transcriptional regulator n=1 Tax=Roseateles aquae TaxID=3077235 RepID=A0ABU3PD09_9BURK|nr:BlaI/MecI/CopY family transcriptional regulator [Paucibacter sp. APW11]MDT9000480.1 BlaI/MecI/CopY family transcriptional regulator [Paucibacter sp. APW11]
MTSISDAETQVMQILWDRHPLTSEEIAADLSDKQDWQLATIKTLINRLLNKGVIHAEKDGRRYLYSPLLSRADWQASQGLGLLDKLFGGSLAPLVAQFSSQRRLSPSDLAALKQLIKDYDNE